ncbi:hypothetical protein [uncultured Ruminococcus sp.]|uniref:hypothetical protein n=1 Tax=uncultured Ruminococcus sp. TaxID=165186 RepID=UPI00267523A0|nr:hypothetical protein [uncultured Ruminococcus sp.]
MAKKHPLFGTRVTPDSGWFYGLWELIRLERQVFRTCLHKRIQESFRQILLHPA